MAISTPGSGQTPTLNSLPKTATPRPVGPVDRLSSHNCQNDLLVRSSCISVAHQGSNQSANNARNAVSRLLVREDDQGLCLMSLSVSRWPAPCNKDALLCVQLTRSLPKPALTAFQGVYDPHFGRRHGRPRLFELSSGKIKLSCSMGSSRDPYHFLCAAIPAGKASGATDANCTVASQLLSYGHSGLDPEPRCISWDAECQSCGTESFHNL